MPIQVIDNIRHLPLCDTPQAWLTQLGRPSWFVLPGRDRSRCRVFATLLHGSEPSGVTAIFRYLKTQVCPAVDLAFFVGSVDAALMPPLFTHRMLPRARDLNRCFSEPYDGPQGKLAQRLLSLIDSVRPEAVLDVHDNTGHAPAYGVGVRAGGPELRLTNYFANKLILSDLKMGTLVEAIADRYPTVVIECGTAGSPLAEATALSGLDRFSSTAQLGLDWAGQVPVEILRNPIRVAIAPGTELAVGSAGVQGATFTLRAGIDRHNFETMPPATTIGWLRRDAPWPIEARGADGVDVAKDLFQLRDQVLESTRPMVPIMMTERVDIATQDCLFYALQRQTTSA